MQLEGRSANNFSRELHSLQLSAPLLKFMTTHTFKDIVGLTKVRHRLIRDTTPTGYVNSDLIFLAGTPIVVLAWQKRPHGDYPAVTVTLDPRYLQKINWPEAEYLYELPIQDPTSEFNV
jgi:hypothetical protein